MTDSMFLRGWELRYRAIKSIRLEDGIISKAKGTPGSVQDPSFTGGANLVNHFSIPEQGCAADKPCRTLLRWAASQLIEEVLIS